MISKLRQLFTGSFAPAAPAPDPRKQYVAAKALHQRIGGLEADPYLHITERRLGVLSVFDDLKYDRSDADILSLGMRRHVIGLLAPLGFKQTSGRVLTQAEADMRVVIPKFHALGSSPFHITRYTPKRAQDYYLLTPTQTACQMIETYEVEEAVARVKVLIAQQPINIKRILDYLERTPAHDAFKPAIGHLKYVQRIAVQSDPLCRRRALR